MFARAGLAGVLWLMLAPAALAAAMPQLWLGPLDNMPHPAPQAQGAVDYTELFAPDATWPEALPQIKVFKVYPFFTGRVSDAELDQIIGFLRDHHIKLALEVGPLTPQANCGTNLEGFLGPHMAGLVNRIKLHGGNVDYVAMDEPLFYGRYYAGPRACRADIASLAANAAANIRALKAVEPGVQVGDIEVANGPGGPAGWAKALGEWAQDFKAATGEKLAFMQLDVYWPTPWLPSVAADAKSMHAHGVKFGVIFNAAGSDANDAAWAEAVRANYASLQDAGVVPDQAVFQTWTPYPTHVLPVQDPETLTGLAYGYVEQFKKTHP